MENEKASQAHKTQLAEIEGRIQVLNSETAHLSEEREKLLDKTKDLEEQLRKEKETRENLSEEYSQLKLHKGSMENEVQTLKSTFDALVEGLNKQVENQEAVINEYEKKLTVTFVDRILFNSGEAVIKPAGKKLLIKVGNILKTTQNNRIRVEGHTDNIPISDEYHYKYPTNWELSSARATAVIRFFQDKVGLDPKVLEAVGLSYYSPIDTNETTGGRAKNRRVEIIIQPM